MCDRSYHDLPAAVALCQLNEKQCYDVQDAYSLIPEQFDLVTNYKSALAGVGGVSFWTFLGNTVIVAVVGAVSYTHLDVYKRQEFLYSEEDRRVVLVCNMENHLKDLELYELMEERYGDM